MKKTVLFFMLWLFVFAGCSEPSGATVSIVPQKCEILAGKEFPISLEGTNIPSAATIDWSVTKGQVNPSSGTSVIYTAPDEVGTVIITAVLESGNLKQTTTLLCEITAVEPIMEIMEATISPMPMTEDPQTPTPSQTTAPIEHKIAITEVMAAPCTNTWGPDVNEYIELYNYGNEPVDVGGWWLATNNHGPGTPDEIVSWNSRNPVGLGSNVITDTTLIHPGGFAVVLTAKYHMARGSLAMPYMFPKDTIILTIGAGNYIGNENTSLLGNSGTISIVILYKGTDKMIDEVISTYGTPTYSTLVENIRDDYRDDLPIKAPDCYSTERIIASGADVVGNWRLIRNGNPGSGDYGP